MPDTQTLKQIVENPSAYAADWKRKNNRPIVGHFCSYTPIEIIIASGALPFRILSSKSDTSFADAHLQSYCCNLVRSSLDDALASQLDFLDGTVFPHTCDTIQRLSDIWRINIKTGFHIDIILPVKLNSKSSFDYMVSVLRKFRTDLEYQLDTKITDQSLREAIVICNRVRQLLGQLYDIKSSQPASITGNELYSIMKAAMVMDNHALCPLLENLVVKIDNSSIPLPGDVKPVLLAGGQCNTPDITSIVERHGSYAVWDDFCTGSRYFQGSIEIQNNLIESIAKRYYERVVCPAKHTGLQVRGDYLIDAARKKSAKGVIFVMQKFCDPHAFDYPYIKEMLDAEGLPSLVIELENQQAMSSQIETRIQAFIEML